VADRVDASEGRVDDAPVADVTDHNLRALDAGRRDRMRQRVDGVENANVVPLLDELLGDMRADEPEAAGDENAHTGGSIQHPDNGPKSSYLVKNLSPSPVGAAFVALTLAACAAGYLLPRHGVGLGAPSPPFYGFFEPLVTPWTALSVAGLAAATIAALRLLAASDRGFLVCSAPLALAIQAVANIGRHGPSELVRPLTGRIGENDALASLHLFTDHPVGFLQLFASRVRDLGLPIHVMGHPPGSTALTGVLAAAGLPGPWPAAATILLVGALGAPLVLLLGRTLLDEREARIATLVWMLAPSVVLESTTSFDAVYATVGTGTALLVVRRRRAAAAAAAVGCSFLSYALLGALVWSLAVLTVRRSARHAASLAALIACTAGVVYAVLALLTGYDAVEAFRATGYAYDHGVSRHRPWSYWVVGDLVAFLVALGPLVALAFARELSARSRIALVTLVVIGIAALGGFSKAEVERIWLFAVPFVAISAAPSLRRGDPRLLLGALALQTALVEIAVGTTW
jgi:hypothetical protein